MSTQVRQLTKAENDCLNQVGPGTEMGALLRRHWWAVGVSADLKDKPTYIRGLGEDLVLFREEGGRPGLIGAYCSHRRANLCLGQVQGDGLRCRYHGWKYDVRGNVTRTPGEQPKSALKDRIRHKAYPAAELGGLVFAYMGPEPVPPLPRFDFLAGPGERHSAIIGFANCNWLQTVENGMDPFHASFTHASTWTDLDVGPEFLEFAETPWGVVYHAYLPTEHENMCLRREHHLLLPGISVGAGGLLRGISAGGKGGMEGGIKNLGKNARLPSSARFTTPMDDTHAMMIRVNWKPADSPFSFHRDPTPPISWYPFGFEPYREYRNVRGDEKPTLGVTWPSMIGTQDSMVLESMLPAVDREHENLSDIDLGIVMYRNMLLQGVEDVKAGRDPKGVVRVQSPDAVHDVTATEALMAREEYEAARQRIVPG